VAAGVIDRGEPTEPGRTPRAWPAGVIDRGEPTGGVTPGIAEGGVFWIGRIRLVCIRCERKSWYAPATREYASVTISSSSGLSPERCRSGCDVPRDLVERVLRLRDARIDRDLEQHVRGRLGHRDDPLGPQQEIGARTHPGMSSAEGAPSTCRCASCRMPVV